ncbi:7 transmembrane sweet-taste receptor of 3 GCPR-domain-containing protein [Umbelopsis sp. PMI_123]|nr:7 transmembrane sweet-taste receptor of 3 GCPR-domain-containing protein [Umbelopsis sp. PMI_123]
MMMMAMGFNNTIHNTSTPINQSLIDLAHGRLGQYLTPLTFNTSFVGPQGPMQIDSNGDVLSGNFLIYNMQNGRQTVVGSSSSSGLNITAPILFHDGTPNAPMDAPPRTSINPKSTSPISIVVMTVSGIGILFSLATVLLVNLFRNRQIFKASSPMFCTLELLGFLLSYTALVLMVQEPSVTSCYVMPTTFHLGYCLIMGNMVTKNYRIFRIFNNIFITRTIVTDTQLLKASAVIIVVQAAMLAFWLGMSTVTPINVNLERSNYYVTCAYHHPAKTAFMALIATYSIGLLAFAIFLAIKTRRVGASYSKYSETKQIGMCVYNILFAGLIGFIVFFLPTAEYITRYYVTVITILWGTTVSLYILFLPKVLAFFRDREDLNSGSQTNSSGSSSRRKEFYSEDEWKRTQANLSAFQSDHSLQPTVEECELISLEQILACDPVSLELPKPSIGSTHFDTNGNTIQGFIEVHEGTLPLRRVNKYLPFLAHWEMQNIMVFPSSRYFSHFSHLTNRGHVFAYSQVSIFSSQPEAYILKIHGNGSTDIHIQVRDLDSLEVWRRYFWHDNDGDNVLLTTDSQRKASLEMLKHHMIRNNSSQSDSHMSQQRLLDPQNSEATICSGRTMVSLDLEVTEAHASSYLQLP